VTLFRGGAGTGKTHTLKEVERAIGASNRPVPVLVLAPQRQQVHDLESAGLRAQTLAQALTTKQFAPYSVVILDEAGQVGVRDMRELIQALHDVRGRLILSGAIGVFRRSLSDAAVEWRPKLPVESARDFALVRTLARIRE